jgi:hypothetical protein
MPTSISPAARHRCQAYCRSPETCTHFANYKSPCCHAIIACRFDMDKSSTQMRAIEAICYVHEKGVVHDVNRRKSCFWGVHVGSGKRWPSGSEDHIAVRTSGKYSYQLYNLCCMSTLSTARISHRRCCRTP